MPPKESLDRRQSSAEFEKLLNLPKIAATLYRHKLLWIIPTVLFTSLGMLHVLSKKDRWEAVQPLIVRDEAIAELANSAKGGPLGRFENNDSLKRFLEIILQVAKNRDVARAALKQVGPQETEASFLPKLPTIKFTSLFGSKDEEESGGFPSEQAIEGLIGDTEVSAAKGTEFGTTEMIFLSVVATGEERAIALNMALGDELDNRMRAIRQSGSESLIAELTEKRQLAIKNLEVVTEKLSAFEGTLGEDIGEMRTLAETGAGGDSNLRTVLTQIRTELREAEAQRLAFTEMRTMLQKFSGTAEAILSAPSRLFESQPALAGLKDGLVEAQLRTARQRGGLTEWHPRVRAAVQNEKSIEAQLFAEVDNTLNSLAAEISLNETRCRTLKNRLSDVTRRLSFLAAHRAKYVNLLDEMDQSREQLQSATSSLAEARGRQEASLASSLITRIGEPNTGSKPVGPGRSLVLMGSAIAGLGVGLSLVYLLAPWQEKRFGRRKSDQVGRRSTDSGARRQPAPQQPAQPPVGAYSATPPPQKVPLR